MAQKKKSTNTNTAKKTPAKKNAGTGSAAKKTKSQSEFPARMVAALVFLLLTLLSVFACFTTKGFLLGGFRSLVSGLVGKIGFYLSSVMFAVFFVTMLRHTGWKAGLRCIGLVMLWASITGIVQILSADAADIPGGMRMIGALYENGTLGIGGGVLGGLLGMLILSALGRIPGIFALLVLAAICLLYAVGITIPSLIRAIQNRPRPVHAPKREPVDPATRMVNTIANKRIERIERTERRKVIADFDVPVDGIPLGSPKKRENSAAAKSGKNPLRHPGKANPDVFDDELITGKTVIPAAEDAPLTVEDIHQPEPEAPAARPAAMPPVKKNAKPTVQVKQPEPPAVVEETEPVLPSQPAVDEEPEPDVIPIPVQKPAEPPMPVFIPTPKPVPPVAAAPAPVVPPPVVPAPQAEVTPDAALDKVTAKEARLSAQEVAMEIAMQSQEVKPEYHFPPIELLRTGGAAIADGTAEMRENSRRLNEALQSFKIEAHICNVTRGPSVTRYEVELAQGVRLAKVTALQDDIALALGASGVRIAAIPDKIAVVGIEVPNKSVSTVALRDVIDSPQFKKSKSKSSFAVGKDIGGVCVVGDISRLPHMLIAGTTGSGKSVCMNSIIISLLYKASPEDVKLIMVDPKMVELGIYNGIPHLLIPVVTDPKKAAGSLQWAVTEMMRRYRIMSDAGVRDLASFNTIVENSGEGEHMPQVVVIIDELADLMLVAAKEVEESICRIAQMGRAAGIHLVIATQRPSADVITGLMKANIPSRIAFAVASAMESRIILDTQGAEKLVGRGDMLFAPLGNGKPKRVQGCFVTDEEVENIAAYVKDNYMANYDASVLEEIEKKAEQTGKGGKGAAAPEPAAPDYAEEGEGGDELLPAAVDVILETGQASVSMLQRRLKLGYARAARIVDEMEERGIVGPFAGSKPRAILVNKEQWAAMKGEGGAEPTLTDLPPVEDLID